MLDRLWHIHTITKYSIKVLQKEKGVQHMTIFSTIIVTSGIQHHNLVLGME